MGPEAEFDYIVVGAGSAGCVIAGRLSAEPGARVALIEAGPDDRRFPVNLKTALPVGNLFLLPHARYNWNHSFTGGPGVNNRSIGCPRGKLFGGCSSVNGSVYIRGHRRDYDEWAALGNAGWSYDDVLPAYKRQERRRTGASAHHGAGGELDVGLPQAPNPLSQAFVEAAMAVGHRRNDDFNGETQDGFGIYELNQRAGVRLSASRAFLHPALARPNLLVFADTLVERIRMRGRRAEGVDMIQRGRRIRLTATGEVILAAGAVNSPHLLMLSGIGPRAHLARHGIAVVHDLPGVGRNLQDHPTVFLSCANPTGESYALSARSAARIALSPWRYLFARGGMLASNVAEAGGFLRTRAGLDRPDVQMTFLVGLKGTAGTMPRRHGFMVLVQLLRPVARGFLELASADPQARPVMHPRFLEERHDVETLIAGLREARRIFAAAPLARYRGDEIEPGREVVSDAALERAVRQQVGTAYHPVGTCRMGPETDPEAVVDPQLRVHGVQNLRVADASIMPNIVGGNTSAPSMMIGERLAAFLTRRNAHPPFADTALSTAA
jgi:choline dehydrogenase-like flavoprotein